MDFKDLTSWNGFNKFIKKNIFTNKHLIVTINVYLFSCQTNQAKQIHLVLLISFMKINQITTFYKVMIYNIFTNLSYAKL